MDKTENDRNVKKVAEGPVCAQCSGPDWNPYAYAYESKSQTVRSPHTYLHDVFRDQDGQGSAHQAAQCKTTITRPHFNQIAVAMIKQLHLRSICIENLAKKGKVNMSTRTEPVPNTTQVKKKVNTGTH